MDFAELLAYIEMGVAGSRSGLSHFVQSENESAAGIIKAADVKGE